MNVIKTTLQYSSCWFYYDATPPLYYLYVLHCIHSLILCFRFFFCSTYKSCGSYERSSFSPWFSFKGPFAGWFWVIDNHSWRRPWQTYRLQQLVFLQGVAKCWSSMHFYIALWESVARDGAQSLAKVPPCSTNNPLKTKDINGDCHWVQSWVIGYENLVVVNCII